MSPEYTIMTTDINGVKREDLSMCEGTPAQHAAWDQRIAALKSDPNIVEIIIIDDWGQTPLVVKRI